MADIGVVLRPAAILRRDEAQRVVEALSRLDVSLGGTWIVNPGLWQRYDKPWDGIGGMSGTSKLVGTIGTAHGSPTRYDITLYRVTITAHGVALGWTVDSLCDDALGNAEMSLARCARAELTMPPEEDPFHAAWDPDIGHISL